MLTTERIRGTKIDAISPLTRLEHDFHPVADELTRAYLKQITIDGHFHADPHPGNVFVVFAGIDESAHAVGGQGERPPRGAAARGDAALEDREGGAAAKPRRSRPTIDVKLALIDFGMTARLSTTLKEHVVRLLLDLADNRGDDAADTMIEIGDRAAGVRSRRVRPRDRRAHGAKLRPDDRRARYRASRCTS